MNLPHAVPIALMIFALPASGAGTGDDAESPPAITASLVPVGTNSDAYWVGEGPGIRAIPLDPGAAPPATLSIRDRKGFKTIPTILNRPSPALEVRGGSLRVFAGPSAGPDGDPPLFAEFKLPETPGHYDIFLNRAADRDDWEKAESMILPASATGFPAGSLRLINLSPLTVSWKIGDEVLNLGPRRTKVVSPASGPGGRLVPVMAAHAEGDGHRIIVRTGVRIAPGDRANLITYPGRSPKKPCEVTWYYQIGPNPGSTPGN